MRSMIGGIIYYRPPLDSNACMPDCPVFHCASHFLSPFFILCFLLPLKLLHWSPVSTWWLTVLSLSCHVVGCFQCVCSSVLNWIQMLRLVLLFYRLLSLCTVCWQMTSFRINALKLMLLLFLHLIGLLSVAQGFLSSLSVWLLSQLSDYVSSSYASLDILFWPVFSSSAYS